MELVWALALIKINEKKKVSGDVRNAGIHFFMVYYLY